MSAPPPPEAATTVVAVQGLGFVGAAMAVAVAAAVDADGRPRHRVVGLDLPTVAGRARVDALNDGRFPFATTDDDLTAAVRRVVGEGILRCGTDPSVLGTARVVVVDVPVDIDWRDDPATLHLAGFEAAIRDVGRHVAPGALVLVETTVPPGTTEKVVVPVLAEELTARGLAPDAVHVAHSYERVMPGPDYLASITHLWRVYAGVTPEAADRAEAFLRSVIDTDAYPLTRLAGPTASETAKVLENTFRASTIALMDEWARFAELVGVDLFAVVDAIRVRPTHANLRTPGFGVGGYCITKDPLFASVAARELWDSDLELPLSRAAVRTNDDAPLAVLDRLTPLLGGRLEGRRILLLGVSYRSDVADTRYSPAETFVRAAEQRGAEVVVHDPLVRHWEEMDRPVPAALPDPTGCDAVVFAVAHREYRELGLGAWLGPARPVVCDASGVLTPAQRAEAVAVGAAVIAIGRGDLAAPPPDGEGTG